MPAEREAERAIVGDDVLPLRGRGKVRRDFVERGAANNRRQLVHAGDVPHGRVPMAGERGKCTGGGQRGQIMPVELRARCARSATCANGVRRARRDDRAVRRLR